MVNLIQQPTVIMAAGNKSKEIAEYVGRMNSATESLSIAHMKSPAGWSEPGQTPEFDEYTVVFRGTLRAETRAGTIDVKAGQAILARRGELGALQHAGPQWRRVCGGVYAGLFSGTGTA
jgi:quercetin dioxygenase-like cupin family protein